MNKIIEEPHWPQSNTIDLNVAIQYNNNSSQEIEDIKQEIAYLFQLCYQTKPLNLLLVGLPGISFIYIFISFISFISLISFIYIFISF